MNKILYVQYGSGLTAPPNWRNFDASLTLRFEKIPVIGKLYKKNHTRFPTSVEYGDIVKGLPVQDESCNAVYCSHVLEHLALEDARRALRNTYKILRPNGIFRMVLPDIEHMVRKYLNNAQPDAAVTLIKETGLGQEMREKGLLVLIFAIYGNSRHLWMWDFKSLEKELSDVGFKQIRRASYDDSNEKMFQYVEDRSRWDNCLGIECRK